MNHHILTAFLALAAAAPLVRAQQSFDSPEAAFAAVAKACAAGDKAALTTIIGPDAESLLADETATTLKAFAEAYEVDHEVLTRDAQRLIQVGEVGYILPVPVVAAGDKWTFDLPSTLDEIHKRRIGRNEITAIDTLRTYVDAQRAYAAIDHDDDEVNEFAQLILSTEGQRDGLYFETGDGEPPSPFGPMVAEKAEYLKDRKPGDPYYGYYYKILRGQGDAAPGGAYDYVINGNMIAGYAMLAWPADYGKSGIMSIIVNHQGKVHDRDLGKDTAKAAAAITAYQPDDNWSEVPADDLDESTVE
ncbi:DUF2950 family protein [Haloferula sp. A504]|uniref:DUF2950 family protein n=1 Tax=Haloferula sp. A504 TaxID=3373601 RepID=UPI0031C95B01|nr:DUF2950 domain-containing protein [Verrucomicrobiaceae bacterium E54]